MLKLTISTFGGNILVLLFIYYPARVRVLDCDCRSQGVFFKLGTHNALLSQFVVRALFYCVKTVIVPYFFIIKEVYLYGIEFHNCYNRC